MSAVCAPERVTQNEVTNVGMIHGWIQDHAHDLVATYCQDINDFRLWVITKNVCN